MATEDHVHALWHAFDSLDNERNGYATKSQLKVVTANISTATGVKDIRTSVDALEDQYSDEKMTLSFEEFKRFIELELFSQGSLELDEMFSVCWMLCSKVPLERQNKILQDTDTYKLWRVFNRLAEPNDYPLRMDHEEVAHILEKIVIAMGRKWNEADFEEMRKGLPLMSFWQVLHAIETKFAAGLDEACVAEAVAEIYDEIINEVVKKGIMTKKGHRLASWKERWFILKHGCLSYFTNKDLREQKGVIMLNASWKIESLPDKGNNRNRVLIQTEEHMKGDKNKYEICAPDPKSKQEWIMAVEQVLESCETGISPQKMAFMKRREERIERRQRKSEEEKKKLEDNEMFIKQQELLEAEKEARRLAEEKVAEEATLRQAEAERMAELQMLFEQVQRLLEEERQAKRDEETVRALQARLLEEEMQKREELEKLKLEQEQLLSDEKKKREEVEEERLQHIKRLEEEQQKLELLEQERLAADLKLQEATDKLRSAEEAQKQTAVTAEAIEKKLLEMEAVKAQKAKREERPIGLARPIQPSAKPILSHRGVGVFTPQQFDIMKQIRLLRQQATDSSPPSSNVITENTGKKDEKVLESPKPETETEQDDIKINETQEVIKDDESVVNGQDKDVVKEEDKHGKDEEKNQENKLPETQNVEHVDNSPDCENLTSQVGEVKTKRLPENPDDDDIIEM
ncbi:uncharacterized protein LOC144448997 [Glandiceps talaboti]